MAIDTAERALERLGPRYALFGGAEGLRGYYGEPAAYMRILDTLTHSGELTAREITVAMLSLFHRRLWLSYLFGFSRQYQSRCYCKACRVLARSGVDVPPWRNID